MVGSCGGRGEEKGLEDVTRVVPLKEASCPPTLPLFLCRSQLYLTFPTTMFYLPTVSETTEPRVMWVNPPTL